MSVWLHRNKNEEDEFIAGAITESASGSGYDETLSSTSKNAVENRVVTTAINVDRQRILQNANDISEINDYLDAREDEPTENSDNLITSGGVYDALANAVKIDNVTIQRNLDGELAVTSDDAISATSTHPVQNRIVKQALDEKYDTINTTADLSPVTDNSVITSSLSEDNTDHNVVNRTTVTALQVHTYEKTKLKGVIETSDEAPTTTAIKTYVDDLTNIDNVTVKRRELHEDDEDPEAVTGHELYVPVDENLDATSRNPVRNSTVTQALARLSGALIFKGNADMTDLPDLADQENGWVYNITVAGETTTDFIEGAGLNVPVGSDIVCVVVNDVKKWELLANSSLYQTKRLSSPITIDETQYNTVETALGALASSALAIIEVEHIADVETVQECIYHDTTTGYYYFGRESNSSITRVAIEDDVPTVVNYVNALPTAPDIKDELYVYNDFTYRGNKNLQTLTRLTLVNWIGTRAQYEALTAEQKALYELFFITDEVGTGLTVSDEVTDGDLNPVTSNAVYNALNGYTQSTVPVVYSNYPGNISVMKMGKLVHLYYQANGTPPATNTTVTFATGLPKPIRSLATVTQEVNGNGRYVLELNTAGELVITFYGNTVTSGTWVTYNQVYIEADEE